MEALRLRPCAISARIEAEISLPVCLALHGPPSCSTTVESCLCFRCDCICPRRVGRMLEIAYRDGRPAPRARWRAGYHGSYRPCPLHRLCALGDGVAQLADYRGSSGSGLKRRRDDSGPGHDWNFVAALTRGRSEQLSPAISLRWTLTWCSSRLRSTARSRRCTLATSYSPRK